MYSIAINQRQDGAYSYVAGTVDARVTAVRVVYSDGSSEEVSAEGGVFIVVFEPLKRVDRLEPESALAPNVRCRLQESPGHPGGYTDAGCA